jgi:hemerythrin-like domain-containing protein
MNLYQALTHDHNEVKQLISSLIKDPDNQELLKQLEEEINVHSLAEEKTFYEALKRKLPYLAIGIEGGVAEHNTVMYLLQRFHDSDLNLEQKKQLLSFLKTELESHINKEEQTMFELAKQNLSKNEEEEIAAKFIKVKERFKDSIPVEEECSIGD